MKRKQGYRGHCAESGKLALTLAAQWTLAVGRGSRAQGAVRSEAAQLRLSRAKCPGYVAKSAQRVGMF